MTIKTLRLKDLVVDNVNELKQFKRLLKFRLKEPKRKIINTEISLYNLEKVLDKPILFIMCLKKTPIPRVRGIPDTILLSLNCIINRMDVIKLLGEIQVTEAKNRQVRKKQLLGLMHKPVLQKSLSMIGTIVVRHISFFTRDIVWLSDQYGRIILTNTTGASLHTVPNTMSYTGGHCVTNDGDLIYIDGYHNINKLYKDKITQYTIRKIREPWMAECVYYSPSSADLLVGMVEYDKDNHIYTDAKVMRFDYSGISCHNIEHNKKGQKLYKFPKYITENHNGDVIVSDLNHGVVVTSRTGRHRFSYTGPSSWSRIYPQGVCVDALSHRFSYTGPSSWSRIYPQGVCVDALSHILVCDAKSKTIQMIDKNGNFLSLLFTEENEITVSGGLAYDIKNHLLYVGATDHRSTVCVYRYIQRKDYITDDFNH
ncbi:uncharacterized protein LOC134235922 [Saccostrea cucullata]|uniref:uncharacterized protein LOC134235922 n=1 Tax=Saccostrea cuccullata TaxID=36930 RepID=UPI002ED019AB